MMRITTFGIIVLIILFTNCQRPKPDFPKSNYIEEDMIKTDTLIIDTLKPQ